jgi:deoxyribonuclease-2
MGICSSRNILSCCYAKVPDYCLEYKVALKIPHGETYLDFNGIDFVIKPNIDEWLVSQYKNKKITNYINYNDEHDDKMSANGGHCKGCIAWNNDEITWLIHSVPKFMVRFNSDGSVNTNATKIHSSEQIYGQSFVFLSGISISQLVELLQHLCIMKPFVDTSTSNTSLPTLSMEVMSSIQLSSISLSNHLAIHHIAKSPQNHIDIFSEMIQPVFHGKWFCETWIRGHNCPADPNVLDNKNIIFQKIHYSSSQDHSKYACNDVDLVYIGDLNRMTTQYYRGGGGVIIQDFQLNKAIRSLMNVN